MSQNDQKSQFHGSQDNPLDDLLGGQQNKQGESEFEKTASGTESFATEQNSSNDPSLDDGTNELAISQQEWQSMQEELKKAQQNAKDHHEKLVRTIADYDNLRKRNEREKADAIRYSNEKLIESLLPVIDSLEMTLSHAKTSNLDEKNPFVEGVQLVLKQFISTLEKFGVQVIEGVGQTFDPNFQEAIGQEPTEEYEPGQVVVVHRKGFSLNDRLVRPAMVTIAKEIE